MCLIAAAPPSLLVPSVAAAHPLGCISIDELRPHPVPAVSGVRSWAAITFDVSCTPSQGVRASLPGCVVTISLWQVWNF